MKRRISIEREYPHSPDQVWRVLTEPELLARWLMNNDFKPVVGHTFTFRSDPQPGWDGITNCEVIEVEHARRLRYTWVGGPLNTEVAFTLSPTTAGTRLRLEHSGFEGLKPVLVSLILGSGWARMLKKKVPSLLDTLLREGHAPDQDQAHCDDAGLWRAFVFVLAPILRRGQSRAARTKA
jgi:uncharacterized protein YndB with AHSA1/START domain